MGGEKKSNPLDLLRQAIEIAMPDLRHYLRPVRKAKVVGVYASKGGKYYADVQPLRNDETLDSSEPVIPKVEIPVIWAGPKRGVVCPPVVGAFCDLSYYDGDPNYPRISNFRWYGMEAPEAELNEYVIQLEPGVEIRIDKQKRIVTLTPENVNTEAGKNWTIKAGNNAEITAGKNAAITAGSSATIQAPQINLVGNQTATGAGGAIGASKDKSHREHEGSYSLVGPMNVQGSAVFSGSVTAAEFIGPVRSCAGCGK